MFAGFGDGAALGVTLAGGGAGFADGDAQELRLPIAVVDNPALPRPGAAFGSLFLLPGIGETLRVNGRVTAIEGGHVRVVVEECFGHCAKAIIRSELWAAEPTQAPDDPTAFIAASRFMALATLSAQGRADLSPKGDPTGSMARLDGDVLWFADRPGNRRVDSFRNIVEQPEIALALLVPGASRIAVVSGRARLTTEEAARALFAVKGKTPLLAIRVEIEAITLRESAALACAKLFVEHIKLNKTGGVGAALVRASLSVPGMTGLIKKGLDKDYRDNLY